eukprot:755509-Hanusia_phi.AAC.2
MKTSQRNSAYDVAAIPSRTPSVVASTTSSHTHLPAPCSPVRGASEKKRHLIREGSEPRPVELHPLKPVVEIHA